ncbi:hypothetical protein KSS87_008896, partial [Heliosperma pusillum]
KVTAVLLRICENTVLKFEFLTEVIYSAANWSGSREHDATHAGYATVGIAAPWIFQALDPWISQLLCSCNVILLIITAGTADFALYRTLELHRYQLQASFLIFRIIPHRIWRAYDVR